MFLNDTVQFEFEIVTAEEKINYLLCMRCFYYMGTGQPAFEKVISSRLFTTFVSFYK